MYKLNLNRHGFTGDTMITLKEFIQLNNISIGDTIIEGSFYNTHYTIVSFEEDFIKVKYQKSYGIDTKLLELTFKSQWKSLKSA